MVEFSVCYCNNFSCYPLGEDESWMKPECSSMGIQELSMSTSSTMPSDMWRDQDNQVKK